MINRFIWTCYFSYLSQYLLFVKNYKHFAVEYYWLIMSLILKKDIAQIISYWSLTQAGYLRNAAFLKMNFTFLLRNDKKKKNFLKQRWKPLFLLNAAFVYRLFFWITYIVFDLWFSQNNFSFSKSKSYYFGEFTLLVRFMNRTTSGIVLSEFVLSGDPL